MPSEKRTRADKPDKVPEPAAAPPARHCPICGKPSVSATRPFCSKRCADIDLHRWLCGVYAIPAAPDEEAEAGPAGAGEASPASARKD